MKVGLYADTFCHKALGSFRELIITILYYQSMERDFTEFNYPYIVICSFEMTIAWCRIYCWRNQLWSHTTDITSNLLKNSHNPLMLLSCFLATRLFTFLYIVTEEAFHVCYGRLPRLEYSNMAPMKKETLLKIRPLSLCFRTFIVSVNYYSKLKLNFEQKSVHFYNPMILLVSN